MLAQVNARSDSSHPEILERPLGDHNASKENVRNSPRKPVEIYEEDQKRPNTHHKTKSAVSLKSLIGNDKSKSSKTPGDESKAAVRLKRPKSSTGLSALLSGSKSPKKSKPDGKSPVKEKENRTPPQTADIAPPPIWPQFATQQQLPDPSKTTRVPLKDHTKTEREAALYTPRDQSPSKQRSFVDPPLSLSPKSDAKFRPLLEYNSSGGNQAFLDGVERGAQHQKLKLKTPSKPIDNVPSVERVKENGKPSSESVQKETGLYSNYTKMHQNSSDATAMAATKPKRGSRVMAAVAALSGGQKEVHNVPAPPSAVQIVDVQAIEAEFESLLETRNIPQNVRDRMRTLNTALKIDFIRNEKSVSASVSSTESRSLARSRDASRKRPNDCGTDENTSPTDEDFGDKTDTEGSPKKRRSRPRSRTFTFSRGDSSPKKDKSERPKSRGRSRSRHRAPEASGAEDDSQAQEGRSRSMSFGRAPKPARPEDFLAYLRKTPKPAEVEVGRLQKLRQLLRNETVVWVDGFIGQGGMDEVIGLLNRILKVEWREEHEDTLLHETLLCLKAMCTTSVALDQLSKMAPDLFPTLLGMLFDEERKGPSEFATRHMVISLLFIHLRTASPADSEARAQKILQYLRDPSKPEASQPPGFIASIYLPRPYRVWCKEIVNVTKEVFWIFLHHCNIIPFPQETSDDDGSNNNTAAAIKNDEEEEKDYRTAHFPRERPPIPASPYIGGVEWDATNYLAAHMDLLNGILACLTSRTQRNALRQELRDSGFEKIMGGTLRTCKEKWYGYVHKCLSTWVGGARADGWEFWEVKEGLRRGETLGGSPRKNCGKGKGGEEAPRLELSFGAEKVGGMGKGEGWL
ncbi:hypothetical protein Q9189_000884 [Teloschistes chrysophthalmus]